MQKALTAKFIENLKPRFERRYEVRDSLLPGFGVRVARNGKLTFFAVGRVDGRQVRHTIGTYPILSLGEARESGRRVLAEIQTGVFRTEPEAVTFGATVDEFIAKHARPKNRDWKGSQSALRKFARFNERALGDVKRRDVVAVLDKIVADGTPHAANRALAAIKKLFAWSLDRGLIEVHPIAGLKPPTRENTRDRVLSDDEIARVWNAGSEMGYPFGPALHLLILTAQRRGEVCGMRWSSISDGVWIIPKDVAKNGRAHHVPLPNEVRAILASLPRFVGSDFVFTTTGRSPISGFRKYKERLDASSAVTEWRLHDLRRTAASGMARIGVAPHVIEKILNHQTGTISGVAAVYNRHAYESEKLDAAKRWASEVQRLRGIFAQKCFP